MDRITLRTILRSYARTVATGHSDADLTPRQRRILEVLLNLASNQYRADIDYSDATPVDRIAVLTAVAPEWSSGYFLAVATATPGKAQDAIVGDFSIAQDRAAEAVRNV